MTQISNAMVRGAKLLSRYAQLPEPQSAFVRNRDEGLGNSLVIAFNMAEDSVPRQLVGLRNLCLWAECFGAYIVFDMRQARAVMTIEGETVNGTVNLFQDDRDRVARIMGVKYSKIAPTAPAALMAYMSAAAPERAHA